MNNQNVIALPPSTNFTPEQALHAALQRDLTDVMIIGFDTDNDFVTLSSRITRSDAMFLLEMGKRWAMDGGRE